MRHKSSLLLVFPIFFQCAFWGNALAEEFLKAPDFEMSDLRGEMQSPSQHRGDYLILYFWATWCPACRQDVENIKGVYERFHPKGLEFISISLDSDLAKLEQFVETKEIHYPVLYDGKGWGNEIAQLYGVNSTPTFLLIDPDQKVISSGNRIRKIEAFLKNIFS